MSKLDDAHHSSAQEKNKPRVIIQIETLKASLSWVPTMDGDLINDNDFKELGKLYTAQFDPSISRFVKPQERALK